MLSHDELSALVDSWTLHLRAEHRSPETVASYRDGVTQYLAWLIEKRKSAEIEPLSPRSVNAWIVSLLEAGKAPKTAAVRQGAVRQFSKWLAAEGEIERDPLLGVKPPKVDSKVVDALSDDQVLLLLKACKGTRFTDRRDEAILRLMLETGARAGEVIAMSTADVDILHGSAVIRRGKGAKGRMIPIGPRTGQAIDRYLRARRKHPLADTPTLWLGDRRREFKYDALRRSMKARADSVGIPAFHLHQLRHTFAKRWLAAGGSEGGLQSVAGWSRRDMIERYVQSARADLAAQEARRLGLGDL
jgi:integrase/recombinase XerD